jgi:hypothetical protein
MAENMEPEVVVSDSKSKNPNPNKSEILILKIQDSPVWVLAILSVQVGFVPRLAGFVLWL